MERRGIVVSGAPPPPPPRARRRRRRRRRARAREGARARTRAKAYMGAMFVLYAAGIMLIERSSNGRR